VTTLTIRNIDPTVKEQPGVRAANRGSFIEAERRAIVIQAADGDRMHETNVAEAIRQRLATLGGVQLEPHPPVPIGEPPRFDP
jgi:antitoxin FitA